MLLLAHSVLLFLAAARTVAAEDGRKIDPALPATVTALLTFILLKFFFSMGAVSGKEQAAEIE